MPLKKKKGKVSENISEFHKGKTYAKTEEKFGKEKADKQAVAVALETERKSGGKPVSKSGHKTPTRKKKEKKDAKPPFRPGLY